MNTLYITDLDGTLLEDDQSLSNDTIKIMNRLIEEGVMITYASARSYLTAHKVTQSIHFKLPVIVQNGAFIDTPDGQEILGHYLDSHVLDVLKNKDVSPIVYFKDEDIHFSYLKDSDKKGIHYFVDTHENDPRKKPVDHYHELYKKGIYYVLVIDEYDKLLPIYDQLKNQYHVILDQDLYSHEYWLEIMSKDASKASGIEELKKMIHCDRVIVFGDGKNDIEMFKVADHSCAVVNGDDVLKEVADEIIYKSVAEYIWREEHMIYPALIEDLETVYHYICILENKEIDKEYFKQAYIKGLEDENTFYFLHEHGFISMHITYYLHHNGPTGEVVELVVDPEYRSQRIGEQLLKYIEDLGEELGLEEICLCTSTYRKQAHKFYELHGYVMNHYNYIKKLNCFFK